METGSDSRHGNPPAGRGILCPGQLAADGPGNNARRENIEDDSVDIEDDPIEVEDTPDSFEALQARAAAYRSAAGCDSDGSSDDSSSDELVAAGPGPIVLSPATQALLSSPALSRMRAMGALGKRSTGRQLSPEGESSEVRIFFFCPWAVLASCYKYCGSPLLANPDEKEHPGWHPWQVGTTTAVTMITHIHVYHCCVCCFAKRPLQTEETYKRISLNVNTTQTCALLYATTFDVLVSTR